MFNFKNIAEDGWFPVKFQSVKDLYEIKQKTITTDNGLKLVLNDFLEDFKDVSVNKGTEFLLTNLKNTTDCLKSKEPQIQRDLTQINTPISQGNNIVGLNSFYPQKTNRSSITNNTVVADFSLADTFSFVFSLKNDEKVVTVKINHLTNIETDTLLDFSLAWSDGSEELIFKPQTYPTSDNQYFSYLLSPDGIVLFKPFSNFSHIAKIDEDGYLKLKTYEPSGTDLLPETSFLKFVSYIKPRKGSDVIRDSHLVKYGVSLSDNSSNLQPDTETKQLPYNQNFLGSFAYNNLTIKNQEAVYELNFSGLKNYQTPEYEYSLRNNGDLGITQREYEHLFTGTNQRGGLDNVFLGYKGYTSKITLPSDQISYFNFASTTDAIALSASGLIEDGAIAGNCPYTSDRIYFAKSDLQLNKKSDTSLLNTVWLCSWLSGSDAGDKTWMDRYYNAGYYTADEALSVNSLVYHDKLDDSKDYVYDVISTTTLQPGLIYEYQHAGPLVSKNYLNYLEATKENGKNIKLLDVSEWDTAPLIDHSLYKNNGSTYQTNTNTLNKNYWELDGSNHAIFPAKTELLEKHHFTVSLWVYSDHWNDLKGRQIFGNFYNSGYGLINESGANSPLLTLADSVSGQVYTFNSQLGLASVLQFPNNTVSENLIIIKYPDYSYWVFDTVNGVGYRYTPESRLMFTSGTVLGVTQIEVDGDLNLYLWSPSNKRVVILNSSGEINDEFITLEGSNINRIEIFKYSTIQTQTGTYIGVIPIQGSSSVVDNLGNVWQIVGHNLYKSTYNIGTDSHGTFTLFANVGQVHQITCDLSNNLWMLLNRYDVTKMTPDGKFTTFKVGTRAEQTELPCSLPSYQYRYINFLKNSSSYDQSCSGFSSEVAVLVDTFDNEITIINPDTTVVSRLDLNFLPNLKTRVPLFWAIGDFTGYQQLRRFYQTSSKNLSWKCRIAEPGGVNAETKTLSYDTTNLNPGWHHFALTFNQRDGEINYYIDSKRVNFVNFSSYKELYFEYESSLLLGADSVKNISLNDLINSQNFNKFKGKVSDLKIYNIPLTHGDIEQLYFASQFSSNRKDLNWNMPVGARNYIEEVKHWFQMQIPGSKSKYYNINIHNLDVPDEIKVLIEASIKQNIVKLAPVHTSLYKINWS